MDTSRRSALRATRTHTRRIARLARRTARVGLDGVLADLDRTGEPCEVPGEAAGRGLTWDAADRDDPRWWPQGVTSTRGGDVLLVSWYAKRPGRLSRTPGARVSVVDRSDPERPRYRHVLLVAARPWPWRLLGRGSGRRLGPVPVHAGGIAVHGDLLHVADTVAGVRVFRLGDVLRLPAGEAVAGHDHVLPQWRRLRVPLLTGTGRLRFSFLSVGHVDGRLSLLAGEYRRAGHGDPHLVRYPLDPATGLPEVGARGRCAPLEVHRGQPPRMQGVAVDGGTWFVTASTGRGGGGDLHVGVPGALVRHRGVLPPGPEDLHRSRPGELWCATEWPGSRWVFPLDADRWRGGGRGGGRSGPDAG